MAQDNIVQSFQLESSNLRGRAVQIGSCIHDILERHAQYPVGVKRLTGEASVLALLLSSMLKYEGVFTLQAQGDGPVSMVVADISSPCALRACAKFKEDPVNDIVEKPIALLGQGHLAFTVDQGAGTKPYQGIVALNGVSLQETTRHYFTQSEQIDTAIRLALGQDARGHWRGGAIMIQRLPEEGLSDSESTENWARATTLLASCTEAELLDTEIPVQDLLFRLFHEEGVRVYDPQPVTESCRCSEDRAINILVSMGPEDRHDMAVDGRISVKCEFCSREYSFDEAEIDHKISAGVTKQ